MKVVELVVELTGTKDCLINGVNSFSSKPQHSIEEKVFIRQLSPDQQWHVLCELRKLLSKTEDAYTQARINRGEILADKVKRR